MRILFLFFMENIPPFFFWKYASGTQPPSQSLPFKESSSAPESMDALALSQGRQRPALGQEVNGNSHGVFRSFPGPDGSTATFPGSSSYQCHCRPDSGLSLRPTSTTRKNQSLSQMSAAPAPPGPSRHGGLTFCRLVLGLSRPA